MPQQTYRDAPLSETQKQAFRDAPLQRPSPAAPQRPAEHPSAALARGVWNRVSAIPGAVYDLATDVAPYDARGQLKMPMGRTVQALLDAHKATAAGASDAFQRGDYLTAARKGVNAVLPMVGPAIDASTDKMMRGDVAEGLGELTTDALLASLSTPRAGVRTSVRPPRMAGPTNAKDAAAVAFAQREGVPLDLGTATGKQTIRNTQKAVANTVAGDAPASALQTAQTEQLTRVGNQLAERSAPAAQTPVSSGESVRAAITRGIQADHEAANVAYAAVRRGAADAQIDLLAFKAQVRPLYDDLLRQAELGTLEGGKRKALAAFDRIMRGPDAAAFTDVDAALSDFKALARGAEMPELRSQGQGIAAHAVGRLDAQVRAAATAAGPDTLSALEQGRAATRAKYAKADVLDLLSAEPAQVYRQLTANRDTAVARLRAVQQVAPGELPNIARAYLEEMMNTATQEGGFAHADKLWADWNKLGPETKRRLFPSEGHVEALDNFFLLAKRIKENPNPSGTAQVLNAPKLNVTQVLAYVPAKVLAKILFTPRAVNYLTQARIAASTSAPRAQAVAIANIEKAAQSAGVSWDAVPALGETERRSTR